MKALTIWQPWASLIIQGLKSYEFRRWPAPKSVRGERIAIHASARAVRRDEIADLLLNEGRLLGSTGGSPMQLILARAFLERAHVSPGLLLRGVILGTAVLGEPVKATVAMKGIVPAEEIRPDIWAWPLTDIRPLAEPRPARGEQGFWNCQGSNGGTL